MINDSSINNLKAYLYNKINIDIDIAKEMEDIDLRIGMIEDLKSIIFNVEDILSISIQLDCLYDKERVEKILSYIYYIKFANKKNADDSTLEVYKKKLTAEVLKIEMEYNELIKKKQDYETRLNNNKEYHVIFKKIMSRIKYKQIIPDFFVSKLREFWKINQEPNGQQIKFLEEIRIYNTKLRDKYLIHDNYRYNILTMLKFGYEMLPLEDYDYNSKRLEIVNILKSLINCDDPNLVMDTIKSVVNDNDVEAIVVKLMDEIQLEIFDQVELIKEPDVYIDEELREEIVNRYIKLVNLFGELKDYFEEMVKDDPVEEEKKEENVEENRLIFSESPSGKPYFMDDLEKISPEYYEKIKKLLDCLITNELKKAHIEGFTGAYSKSLRKLKVFKVRIILKQLNPNTFAILGVGIKKDTKGNYLYDRLCNRGIPEASEENLTKGKETVKKVYEYIEQNSRKGTR